MLIVGFLVKFILYWPGLHDYGNQISKARPVLPDELNDRQQDNWDHYWSIAECAGPEWVGRNKSCIKTISY